VLVKLNKKNERCLGFGETWKMGKLGKITLDFNANGKEQPTSVGEPLGVVWRLDVAAGAGDRGARAGFDGWETKGKEHGTVRVL